MAIAPVLKTGARKGMGVRVPRSPSYHHFLVERRSLAGRNTLFYLEWPKVGHLVHAQGFSHVSAKASGAREYLHKLVSACSFSATRRRFPL